MSAFLDANPTNSSDGSQTWARRQNYLNRAQQMWAESLDWRTLYKEYSALISTPSGTSTHSLPSDYRKLAGHPVLSGTKFYDVEPFEKVDISTTSKITYILGTPGSYKLIVRWGETPDSLTSLMLPYYHTPPDLTTQGAISPIPDPEYLAAKAIGMELRSLVKDHTSADKEDARAELILKNMISTENTPSFGNERRIKTAEERMGFLFGIDG
jgi:hypothetical protein